MHLQDAWNVQVNVGVLVALIQITLGMRKMKMLTICKIHVNDLLYFMEKNLGNIC